MVATDRLSYSIERSQNRKDSGVIVSPSVWGGRLSLKVVVIPMSLILCISLSESWFLPFSCTKAVVFSVGIHSLLFC